MFSFDHQLQFPSHTLPIQQHHQRNGHQQNHSTASRHYQQRHRIGERDENIAGEDASLLLHYVTERILASVLPPRSANASSSPSQGALAQHSPNSSSGSGIVAEGGASDDHERELIVMLEQKHGKVSSCKIVDTWIRRRKVCRLRCPFDIINILRVVGLDRDAMRNEE